MTEELISITVNTSTTLKIDKRNIRIITTKQNEVQDVICFNLMLVWDMLVEHLSKVPKNSSDFSGLQKRRNEAISIQNNRRTKQ
jgi:hypothetical protein